MSTVHDIASKLQRLRNDCDHLEVYRKLSVEEFLADDAIKTDTCYLLFTTCQIAQDIGIGLVGVLGLPGPDDAERVFDLLVEEEVLSQVCVSQLRAMQILCGSLSQQYEQIDPRWVYQTLQVNLAGLGDFAQQAQAFLEK